MSPRRADQRSAVRNACRRRPASRKRQHRATPNPAHAISVRGASALPMSERVRRPADGFAAGEREIFDRQRLIEVFGHLGADLADRGLFVELAIYGGSALMLHYARRRRTEDVDAVLRPGYREEDLAPSISRVADTMGLAADWLNDAVQMFTPLREDETLFQVSGNFPAVGVARPPRPGRAAPLSPRHEAPRTVQSRPRRHSARLERAGL